MHYRSPAVAWMCLVVLSCGEPPQADSANEAEDRAPAGEASGQWTVLFDGEHADHWRGFRMQDLPDSWLVRDGTLRVTPSDTRADIVTRDRFGDFELELEWRVQEGGNSGIFFRVTEEAANTYETGPEMQILDNRGHPDGRDPVTSAGSNFGLHAPARDATRPVGEWNRARLRVRGPLVEHWLNDVKVVEYRLWTEDWKSRVANSKFEAWPGYGLAPEGHVALQDHGDPVWFRNVRIRPLNEN